MLPDFSKGQIRFLMHEDDFVDDGVSSLSQLQLCRNSEVTAESLVN